MALVPETLPSISSFCVSATVQSSRKKTTLHNPFWSLFRPTTPISLGHRMYLIKAVFWFEENLVKQLNMYAQLGYRDSQGLKLGPPGLRAHSPLCLAFPVIRRRRWVLLVRVALGGFLVESCARRGCFLLTFFRLCACSVAVREEMR